jgi:acyl carrier protein
MDARAAPHAANKIRALIAKYLGIDAERVTDEAHFRNDFDLDSLDQLELLILIEEEFFGTEFSDDAVEQIEVVGDLIRYIEINCCWESCTRRHLITLATPDSSTDQGGGKRRFVIGDSSSPPLTPYEVQDLL